LRREPHRINTPRFNLEDKHSSTFATNTCTRRRDEIQGFASRGVTGQENSPRRADQKGAFGRGIVRTGAS
jgi:hypothetical protein